MGRRRARRPADGGGGRDVSEYRRQIARLLALEAGLLTRGYIH